MSAVPRLGIGSGGKRVAERGGGCLSGLSPPRPYCALATGRPLEAEGGLSLHHSPSTFRGGLLATERRQPGPGLWFP